MTINNLQKMEETHGNGFKINFKSSAGTKHCNANVKYMLSRKAE